MPKNILVTGSSAGLGRFIVDRLQADGLTRHSVFPEYSFNSIVHCAFNTKKKIKFAETHSYLEDNIFLTQKLCNLKPSKFVFISSVNVYPSDHCLKEDSEIDINSIEDIYGITKFMCESIVASMPDYIILRCTSLLGPGMKNNTITKILGDGLSITLSSESMMNFVCYEDMLKFINLYLDSKIPGGIYNIASSEPVSLAYIVERFSPDIDYGSYTYKCPNPNNEKARSYLPSIGRSSLQVLLDTRESIINGVSK